jgi:hypothetical protein
VALPCPEKTRLGNAIFGSDVERASRHVILRVDLLTNPYICEAGNGNDSSPARHQPNVLSHGATRFVA